MLKKGITCDTSTRRSYYLSAHQFKETTTTSKREGPFLSKGSKRLINNDFTIRIENFELEDTAFGSSFIMMPTTTMLAIDVAIFGVTKIS
jgi:hypothetical protein